MNHTPYVVQKRVANTEYWGAIANGKFATYEEALEAALNVDGGPQTGVRIVSGPYPEDLEIVVGC